MDDRKGRTAFAAFDFGTSAIKAAVWLPGHPLRMLTARANRVRISPGGHATCSASEIVASFVSLLEELAGWTTSHRIDTLHLGLCAHVSSLILWNVREGDLESDAFPIWMDTSGRQSVPALREFFSKGRDRKILGTSMPVVPNWLSVMIASRLPRGAGRLKILQVHDYLYYLLTGFFETHYSGQVSIIHNQNLDYADELLQFLRVDRENLPVIQNERCRPLRDPHGMFAAIALPSNTCIHPGLADRTAAFVGMGLENREGFILASTSENAGIYLIEEHDPPERLVCTRHGGGWIHYGSTTSGGATVAWFLEAWGGGSDIRALEELYHLAQDVPPGGGGAFFHPYLGGERAPHWNEKMAASFTGLRVHHRKEHLLRAVLEGIAFGKRQLFEALGAVRPFRIKVSGGGARRMLQNRIRASVLKTDLEVFPDVEFSLIGLVRFMFGNLAEPQFPDLPQPGDPVRVRPIEEWCRVYDRLYPVYVDIQERLEPLWNTLAEFRGEET